MNEYNDSRLFSNDFNIQIAGKHFFIEFIHCYVFQFLYHRDLVKVLFLMMYHSKQKHETM